MILPLDSLLTESPPDENGFVTHVFRGYTVDQYTDSNKRQTIITLHDTPRKRRQSLGRQAPPTVPP